KFEQASILDWQSKILKFRITRTCSLNNNKKNAICLSESLKSLLEYGCPSFSLHVALQIYAIHALRRRRSSGQCSMNACRKIYFFKNKYENGYILEPHMKHIWQATMVGLPKKTFKFRITRTCSLNNKKIKKLPLRKSLKSIL